MIVTTIQACPTTCIPTKDLYEIHNAVYAAPYPAYYIPFEIFSSLLSDPAATVFLAQPQGASGTTTNSVDSGSENNIQRSQDILGFALIYLMRNGASDDPANQHLKGGLALLCVHPEYQSQGVGTALHNAAISNLSSSILSSFDSSTPRPESGSIMLGSIFPRIFPGLPLIAGHERVKSWLEKKGWKFKDEMSYDLYRPLPGPGGLQELEKELKGLMERAERAGYRCGEYNGDREGLAELEKEFWYATGWPDMILTLADGGYHQDLHCVYDPNGKIVGATAAALRDPGEERGGKKNEMHAKMVWPNMVGKACGSIGCVGISSNARNPTATSSSQAVSKGLNLGTALIASATLSLARRGADGVFIDWVREGLRGFYGKVGVGVWEVGYHGAEMTVKA